MPTPDYDSKGEECWLSSGLHRMWLNWINNKINSKFSIFFSLHNLQCSLKVLLKYEWQTLFKKNINDNRVICYMDIFFSLDIDLKFASYLIVYSWTQCFINLPNVFLIYQLLLKSLQCHFRRTLEKEKQCI